MKKCIFFIFFLILSITGTPGQAVSGNDTNTPKIQIPDIPGYKTLKCDFHIHTVFSDGVVWPDIRVREALAEGLDAISLTDHVESHRQEMPDNHVVPYQIALKSAERTDLVVIPGGEISASPDHFNALFLANQDEPGLRDTIPEKRIAAAKAQGGFVFWNHPGWTAKYKDGNAPVVEPFITLARTKQIEGIEICNGDGYWENAHKLARQHNLTLIGNSDIHGVSYYPYQPDKHRTITLVFAREKSVEGIREALLNQRTAIYQGDHLIGDEKFLKPLFFSSLTFETVYGRGTTIAGITITNHSDIDFHCENKSPYSFYNSVDFFTIKAHSTVRIGVKVNRVLPEFSLDLTIHNLIPAPGENLKVAIPLKIREEISPDPEAVIRELYSLVTFEAGSTPDWNRVRSLFLSEAVIVLRTSRDSTTIFSLEGFIDDFVRFIQNYGIENTGFSEKIIKIKRWDFGDMAHFIVLYEASIPGSGRPPQQGVDSFQLILKEGRWKIASITNEIPASNRPVPPDLRY